MMQYILAVAGGLILAATGAVGDYAILQSVLGPGHPAYLESEDPPTPPSGPGEVRNVRLHVRAAGFAGERCESRVSLSGMRAPTGLVVDWRAVRRVSLEQRDGAPAVVISGGIAPYRRIAIKLARHEDSTRVLLAMERLQTVCGSVGG